MVIRRLIFVSISVTLFILLNGFRALTDKKWNITKDDPTIWVKFDDEDLTVDFKETKFGDDDDPIASYPNEQQLIEVIKLIFADYNNIETSFLRLAFYPSQTINFGTYSNEDSPFTEDLAEKRTITVKKGSSVGLAGGHAGSQDDGEHTTQCKIVITPNEYKAAKEFKKVLTHEIGHCLGLAHAHVDRDAIMGYNVKSSQHSLGADDKMGITYFYPEDEAYAEETANFGLACARKSN